LGILAVLACALASARADAQEADLINAARNGDLPHLKALLDAKADVNAKTTKGVTALGIASQFGNKEVVRLLKSARAARR
jgi:ankyrin repeat protein